MSLIEPVIGKIAQLIMLERKQEDALHLVRATVPADELWAQLAEEATELAHAALKYRRSTGEANPTPVKPSEAFASVMEEVADVLLLVHVLSLDIDPHAVELIGKSKLLRWRDRLQGKSEEA